MITKHDVVVGILILGILLLVAGIVISEKGRMKSGIPDHVSVHQANGKYYYHKGNPKNQPAKEITEEQYRTYVIAERRGKVPFFLGVAMSMGAGTWLIISNIVSQASSKGKRGP
jgi:hypothetical protein